MQSRNTKKKQQNRCENCIFCIEKYNMCKAYRADGDYIEIPYIENCPRFKEKDKGKSGDNISPEQSLRKYLDLISDIRPN